MELKFSKEEILNEKRRLLSSPPKPGPYWFIDPWTVSMQIIIEFERILEAR